MQQYFEADLTKTNKKIEGFLISVRKELNSFFGIKMWQPFVILVNSRKDIDRMHGRKTEDWLVGWTSGCNIFILKPKVFTKESSHKDREYFWKVLKHEYCHLYFKQMTSIDYPAWLNEGLACYLAKQKKTPPSNKEALEIFKYYKKLDKNIYRIGYFWVNFLIKKFGKNKLMELIKSLKPQITEKQFAQNFYRIYQIYYSVKDFEKLLTTIK